MRGAMGHPTPERLKKRLSTFDEKVPGMRVSSGGTLYRRVEGFHGVPKIRSECRSWFGLVLLLGLANSGVLDSGRWIFTENPFERSFGTWIRCQCFYDGECLPNFRFGS